jgi:hypothetical protein
MSQYVDFLYDLLGLRFAQTPNLFGGVPGAKQVSLGVPGNDPE